QAIMAAGAATNCSFTMTGGIWTTNEDKSYNEFETDTSKYVYVEQNGGAVWMDDPKGVAVLSGGTIQNCTAENGGAIYMTAGTFTLSGTGKIDNCTATGNGGAVYLGGGNVYVTGGTVTDNAASQNGGAVAVLSGNFNMSNGAIGADGNGNTADNGGAVYVAGGNVNVTGGNIENNTASQNGGGIYVQDGNYTQVGGNVSNNTATNGKGGGVFASANTANVAAKILSGNVSSNTAGTHGGAIAVVGNNAAQVQVIIGVNEQHFDTAGNEIDCDHDEKEANSLVQDAVLSCPIVSNNRVTATTNSGGGAVYVTEGNGTADETLLYIYCLTAKENAVNNTGTTESLSDFMLVEGGTVQVSTELNPTEQNQPATYGCIDITGNMHVVGGKVDLWGNTKNPLVNGIITVDIAEDEEWCRDHREVDNGYTITYYENMGNDVMRYNSYPIASGEEIEIKGNIFNRPGYKLLGWNTSAGTQEDPLDEGTSCNDVNGVRGWYAVGSKHLFGNNGVSDCGHVHTTNLVLYAIWGANGYTVQFDANVPSGISYENNYPDKNASQVFNYDVEAPLIANQYFYPGHIFDGWTTNADGSGTVYTDTQPVKNLAQSGTITLYAKWNVCPHDSSCTFTYTASGATLTKTCSCKAYSESITISAENATYNGSVHDATLSTDTWGLSIQYKKGDEVLSGAPVNAGTYTAGITVEGVTASVTYTINKATQPAPVKPTFTVDGNKLTVNEVNPSEKASSDTAIKTMYQLVYYTGNTEGKSEAQETRTFTLDQAYTSYYVQVWYSAGTNHLASDVVKSTQTHYFEGYVRIDVNCDIGIAYQLIKNTGEGANGLSLDIRPESGYYLSDLKVEVDNVNTVITKLGSTESGWEVSYDITNIPTGTEGNTVVIQVNITGAKKAVSIDAQVVENQVFDTVTGDSTANITAASSYTAYFAVESYDSAAYSGLSVKFDPGLKNGTKVILQDKTNNTYWHYTATGNETSGEVALTAFKRMGAEEITYTLSGNSLKLQFVVDRVSANTVTSLVAAKTNSNAPDLNGSVTTNVDNNTAFVLNSTDNGTLTQTVTHTYTVTNSYTDTQWDYRHGALLLSEKTGTNLPADARISIAIGNAEAVYYKNGNNQFVIPLGEIGTGSADLTLMSDFIPDSGASYTLTAQWMASASIADLATGNGNLLGTIDVVFTSAAKTVPAVEINTENNNRLVTAGSTYDVTITYRDIPESYTASVRLYRAVQNENGEFDFAPAGGAQTISLPSTAQSISYKVSIPSDRTGSAYLCLELKDGLNVVKTVEHYFIIEEAPNNDESPNGNHI
ncbi:MAG: InlB B-repeat-containing protein, partial [Peptococcaceae bacterium]|nr:InlB B-repeat-containing protein [Peptococcaceae bacterium]